MPDLLIHDLRIAVAALAGPDFAQDDRIGVAVSGGPDSMALLHLAAAAFPGRVEAATVDHGLRVESAAEAAMVAQWCAGHGVSHAILHPETPITGSLQAQARAVRYRLLDAWMDQRGLAWLLTAHHADDQCETLLMRLNRASGVGGLSGIRARRGRVLRPLLAIRKAALVEHARAAGLAFVDDPSNGDARFDRARVRKALESVDWLDPVAMGRSAQALADADAALDWTMHRLIAEYVVSEGDSMLLRETGLPRELLRRILLHMIARSAPEERLPRGEQIEQAIIQLFHGKRVSIGACVVTGGSVWKVRRAPPRRTG